ncbi:hypothetical protein LT493_04710 [Streptomyces tricolor]|nr:hypothetical protein [Streptomyces tricolor]
MGAVLTAELLGVPQLPTPSGFGNILDPAETLEPLNERRRELGLPGQDDALSVVPHGRVDYVPPAFSFARHLPKAWSYRQTVDVERGGALPGWAAELPTDRPLVYAAIGTASAGAARASGGSAGGGADHFAGHRREPARDRGGGGRAGGVHGGRLDVRGPAGDR